MQKHMNEVHRQVAAEIGALLAPVGEKWWEEIHRNPSVDLYYEDRRHASVAGSTLAARVIFDALGIGGRMVNEEPDISQSPFLFPDSFLLSLIPGRTSNLRLYAPDKTG